MKQIKIVYNDSCDVINAVESINEVLKDKGIEFINDGKEHDGFEIYEMKDFSISEQDMVKEFHKVFDILINTKPTIPDTNTKLLRSKLIQEELEELKLAFEANDLIETADAIADLLYVVYGTAVSCGIDMKQIFKEVHRSNMTKVGGYRREDGKWIKPTTYSRPVLKPLLDEQLTNEKE